MTILDRLLGRAPEKKAVYGGILQSVYANDIPLSVRGSDDQQRMAAYLRAYKCGWFYKAGKKISGDVALLARTLAYEDDEGDNADEITVPPLMEPWQTLDPLEQFLRLMERPNEYQTGRTLFTKTQIRLDFAGLAYWYLENGEGGQLPTAIFGISPTRMWPSVNPQGRLIGWVMDKDRPGGGVPFTVDEILPFIVPGGDEDMWIGQGVVEAVYANVPLSEQMARHTSNVLTTGGRLAGMLWPRERSLDEAEFVDAQRAWRNVSSDPNAAKRLLIFPEPMEYAAGASTPAEIGVPELAELSRDEILTAFPISPYQLGVPMPGGLNSAETRKEDRHDYWEGSIHPRVELLEETIQWGLVNRYEREVGAALDFDIEEPNLDDAVSLKAKVDAFKALVSVGFDPKESVAAVALDQIEWLGLPDLLDPAKQAEAAEAAREAQLASANQPPQGQLPPGNVPKQLGPGPTKAINREDVIGLELPGFQSTMQTFLYEQKQRIIADVEESLGSKSKAERKDAGPDWWHQKREDDLLRETLRGLYVRLARTALTTVAESVGRIVYADRINGVSGKMLKAAAERITGINETTRQAVQDQITEGTRRGYSISQIANGVGHEAYAGIRNAAAFDDARAELVARTETMLAYNKSALLGYQEFDVTQVEAIDGDDDEVCAERNGQVYSVEEALEIEDHPNGTLDWVPLSDKSVDHRLVQLAMKAIEREPQPIHVHLAPSPDVHVDGAVVLVEPTPIEVKVPKQAAPVVNVAPEAPIVSVNVPEPVVNVTVPEAKSEIVVNVPPAEVSVKAEMTGAMRITEMPARVTRRSVSRNRAGAIESTTEVEEDV